MLKKLTLAPLFLISLSFLSFQLPSILSVDLFSFSTEALIQFLIFATTALVTSFLFCLFVAFSQDIKIVLTISLVSISLPIIFLGVNLGGVFAVVLFLGNIITFLSLSQKLKSYLTFQPTTLLTPQIKTYAAILIAASSLVYYFNISLEIKNNGFSIPNSLIDTALKIVNPEQSRFEGITFRKELAQIPSLTLEQLEFIKNNPDLLKQYGVDPNALNSISPQPAAGSSARKSQDQTLIKNLVKVQINKMLAPYQGFIAPILALLFFLTLHSLTVLLALMLSPLIWATFYILEKIGFIHFEEETRKVRKMVV